MCADLHTLTALASNTKARLPHAQPAEKALIRQSLATSQPGVPTLANFSYPSEPSQASGQLGHLMLKEAGGSFEGATKVAGPKASRSAFQSHALGLTLLLFLAFLQKEGGHWHFSPLQENMNLPGLFGWGFLFVWFLSPNPSDLVL